MRLKKFNEINETSEITGYDNSVMMHNNVQLEDFEQEIGSLENYLYDISFGNDIMDIKKYDEETVKNDNEELEIIIDEMKNKISELTSLVIAALDITQKYNL